METKNSNAGYDKYLDAKNVFDKRIAKVSSAFDHFDLVQRDAEQLIKKYRSAEFLLKCCLIHKEFPQKILACAKESSVTLTPRLSREDLLLCHKWSNYRDFLPNDEHAYVIENIHDRELCRLLSARAAEKAVMVFFSRTAKKVIDVSLSQLNNKERDWVYFDLKVDNLLYDVKNSRESFSSPQTYVEHCIPNFKKERNSNDDIWIAGTLSKNENLKNIYYGKSEVTFLGQVNINIIRKIYRWAKKRFGNLIDFDGMWKNGYVPGWMFEYNKIFYAETRKVIESHIDFLEEISVADEDNLFSMPPHIFAVCRKRSLVEKFVADEGTKKIILDMLDMESVVGITRASLYIYIIGIFLEKIKNRADVDDFSSNIYKIIFSGKNFHLPLGLLDVQRYIFNVVKLLQNVADELRHPKYNFVSFRMHHPSILKGKLPSGTWVTLVAYCGGRITYPFPTKCGNSPLIIGKQETCLSCSCLICNKCNFCHENCTRHNDLS